MRAGVLTVVLLSTQPLSAEAGQQAGASPTNRATGWKATLRGGARGLFLTPVRVLRTIKENPKATLLTATGLTTATVLAHAAGVNLTWPMIILNATVLALQGKRLVPRILRTHGAERAELIGEMTFWTALAGWTTWLGMGHDHGQAAAADPGGAQATGHEHAGHAHGGHGGGSPAATIGGGAGLIVHAPHFAATFGQLVDVLKGNKPAASHHHHD